MSSNNDFDLLSGGIKEVELFNHHKVFVGSLKPTGDRTVEYNQMIAEVQNNGATITPKNGVYLTIPMPIAGKRHAREIDGLFFRYSKNGKPTLSKLENGKIVVYFLLSLKVKIPARPFITNTVNHHINHVAQMIADEITEIYLRKTNVEAVLNKVGKYLSVQMKKEMVKTNAPGNSTITKANKGFDNPLFDTGALQRSISWVVV